MTPLTPGKVLRHLNENSDQLPDNLQEIIARRAEDIVKEVVPNTPIEEAHLPTHSKAQDEVLLSPFLLPLQQYVMHPVERVSQFVMYAYISFYKGQEIYPIISKICLFKKTSYLYKEIQDVIPLS